MKDKVIYLAGYLEHKYRSNTASVETETENENDVIHSKYLSNLNIGGLTVPLVSTIHFVYSAYRQFDHYNLHCCRAHIVQALSCINSPMAAIKNACISMSNILLKAYVLNKSDRVKQLGCLRRKEKLSSN